MIRLALRVARADAELALAELLELVPAGVEEVDRGDSIEYAVYGSADELPALPALRAVAGDALFEITTSEVADDWASRWRSFHQPVTIGDRLHVRAPWHEPPDLADGLLDIAIDPGQAFGTGAHATTRLCLQALLDLEPGGALVDLGCGSGVLAIAARRLGWEPVLGYDHEPESVATTRDNAAANGVIVDARRFDLLRDGRAPVAETTVANLMRPLLLHLSETSFEGETPRTLVLSGLLEHEADELAAAFARVHSMRERRRDTRGGWAALTLVA